MRFDALPPRTLRARVTIATAVVLATVLILVAVFVDDRFRRQANAGLDASLDVEADAIASLTRFEEGKLELDFDGQGRLARFEGPRNGAYYMLSAPGLQVVRSPSLAGKELDAAVFHASFPQRQAGVAVGPYEERVRWHVRRLRLKELHQEESAPRPGARELPIEVRVARSTADIDSARSRIRAGLGLAVPLGLALGTLVAYLLAGRATAPIRRLSAEARAVGTKGAGSRLDVARVEGELRELADTLNAAFDRLEVAAERERQFAAAASHELKTPLAVLRARLEVTLSRDRAPEEYREAIRTALAAGARLEALTAALLLLARLEAHALERESVDLVRVVEAAALGRPAGSPGGDPLLALPEEEVRIQGNAVLLERLVAGLLENARTHGADADVRVALRRDGDQLVLEVMDRGPGFPPDLLARLFEPFSRGDASRSRATGGAGLGLSIAHSIVTAHGGRIVASQRPDGGAIVTVTLQSAPVSRGHGV